MASRRALSLRSLFSARCYHPSYYSSISHRHDNDHHEEKPTFLGQRSFSSSVFSHHPRSSSDLSPCTPFGASICRSMSTSSGSDESVAGNPIDSVVENVVTHVPSDWLFHFDSVQRLIETVHSFTGLDWMASIVLTTLLIRGMTIPLMIYHARGWSRTMMLVIHATETKDPAAVNIEFKKLMKEYGGVFSLSTLLPCLHLPALICMGTTIHNMTGGWLWYIDLSTIYISLLTGLTFRITVKYDAIVSFEGALIAHRKFLSRKMVIPVVLGGLLLSKEVHCYLMSCMLFSIAFMYVIRRPRVKKHLRIPEVPENKVIVIKKKFLFSKQGLRTLKLLFSHIYF